MVFDFASKAAAEHRRLRDGPGSPAAIRRGAGIARASEAVPQSAGVRQAAKQNFNLATIILVLAIGGLIIRLGLTVDSCVGICQRRWEMGMERQQQWLHDGTLQPQRLVYKGGALMGGWMS